MIIGAALQHQISPDEDAVVSKLRVDKTRVERFGIANTEYRYIGIKISVNTGISPAFGVFLRKQIELCNADKNKF